MAFNPLPSRFWRLYHHPTRPEIHLEPLVAALGVPYRFQFPIPGTPWFADYSFPTLKVLLEIDGESHRRKGAAEKDAARDKRTSELGWATVRVSNETALATHQPETVRRWIESARNTASSAESDCKMSDSSIPPWLSTPMTQTTVPTPNPVRSPVVSGRVPRKVSAKTSAPSWKGKRQPKGDK